MRSLPLYLTKDNESYSLVEMTFALRLLSFLGLFAVASAEEPTLKIIGTEKTLTFTTDQFATMPHTEIAAFEPHEQKERHYSGVAVRDLLARVGAPLGDKLRGPALQLVVTARCRDGYAVVFALADFDESFTSRTILLADKEDGQSIPENAAPFRLVAPGDKKAARWARMVTALEITSLAPPPAAISP